MIARENHHHVYVGAAFVAGILVTIGVTDLYSILKKILRSNPVETGLGEDRALIESVRRGPPAVVDGVEGCIGNTPLLRIKSLSDATGCEILAKVEVCTY